MSALPVVRLEAHWVEQLGSNYEVQRVLCCAGKYLWRVVPHRARTWRAERREKSSWGEHWVPLKQKARGPYGAAPERSWRSPEAAMRAVEGLVEVRIGPAEKRSNG